MEHMPEIVALTDQIKKLNQLKKELTTTLQERNELVLEDMKKRNLEKYDYGDISFEVKNVVKTEKYNKNEKIQKLDDILKENQIYMEEIKLDHLLKFEKNRHHKTTLKISSKK